MKKVNEIESDLCLLAACAFVGLDYEVVTERAGVLEFDDGLPRDVANRQALFEAMNDGGKSYSRRLVNQFFDLAGPLFELEQENGWPRARTIREMAARLEEDINARG